MIIIDTSSHALAWQRLSPASNSIDQIHHNPRDLKRSSGRSNSPATGSLRGYVLSNSTTEGGLALVHTNSMERRPASSVDTFIGTSSHGILNHKDSSRWSSRLVIYVIYFSCMYKT